MGQNRILQSNVTFGNQKHFWRSSPAPDPDIEFGAAEDPRKLEAGEELERRFAARLETSLREVALSGTWHPGLVLHLEMFLLFTSFHVQMLCKW